MKIKGLILLTILFGIPAIIMAQGESKVVWQDHYEGFRKDAANKIVEDYAGNLVLVGNTMSKGDKKQDMLFWKVSPTGRTLFQNVIGTKEEEAANAITPTFDGGFVIAGYTDTWKQEVYNGKDPLLVKVDERGEPVFWYEVPGSTEDDAFFDVLQMADGSIVAAGHLGSSIYVVKIDPEGKLIRKTFGGYNSVGRAITQNSNNELVVTGNWGNLNEPVMFVTKLIFRNDDIDKVWQKTPRTAAMRMNKGLDIIHLLGGGYAIVGTGKDKSNEEKLGLVLLNENGRGQKVQAFGGLHEEGGNSLVQTADGNLLMAGYSNSHQRGARRNKAWLQLVNKEGDELWGEKGEFVGGKQEDELVDLVETSDGQLFAVGQTSSENAGNQDGWILKIGDTQKPAEILPTQLSISQIRFVDENNNDTLDARERSYLHFMIKNEGEATAFNVNARTTATGRTGGLDLLRKVIIGRIGAGDSIFASVPVGGKSYLGNGRSNIHVSLEADNDLSGLNSFSYTIISQKEPLPHLKITKSRFLTLHKKGAPNRRERIRLEVELTNLGERPARDVEFKFIFPQKVEAVSIREHQLGDIAVMASQKLFLDFYAASFYEFDSIKIGCVAREKSHRKLFNEHFTIKLTEFGSDVGPTSNLEKEPTYPFENEEVNKNGGPSFYIPGFSFEKPRIEWLAPLPKEEQALLEFYVFKDIDIKLRVTSDSPLDSKDFNMWVNDKRVIGLPFFDPKNVKISQSQNEDGLLEYIYQNKIRLESGDNILALEVNRARSKRAVVNYILPKGNLHVFSFGIPHEDLNYTLNDACGFSNSFENQSGALYKDVRIITYTSKDSTTKRRLEFAIQDIQNDYYFEDIGVHDVVMLYFSSHGFTYRDTLFYIAASDYDDHYPQQTSLDFQREVLEILDEVNCRKVIFIDACKSGSTTLTRLATQREDYQFMVSSSPDEVSHEDTLWQHGAFTRAILEALGTVDILPGKRPEKIDLNNDKVLNLKEIFTYVRYRVPALLKTKKPRIKETQTPFMPSNEDFPLFALNQPKIDSNIKSPESEIEKAEGGIDAEAKKGN